MYGPEDWIHLSGRRHAKDAPFLREFFWVIVF